MRISPQAEQPDPETEPRRLAALAELLTHTTRPGRATRCQQLQEVDLPIIAIHPALSKDSQRILLLRCALWFEPKEIGRIADLPAASVDTRLRTAYRRLRSVGLGDPVPRDGLLERTRCCLDVLEELYWRADELTATDPHLSGSLHDAVVRRTQLLARQKGAVGGEANALLAFFSFTAVRLGREGPTHQDGWWHLRAAEEAGAGGRHLWLARILATYVTADATATMDWRSIALMWEKVQETERPSSRHWLGRPSSPRLTAADRRVTSTR